MADENNVQVVISANDTGASAVFTDVVSAITRIEANLGKMSIAGKAAGDAVSHGAHKASSGVAKVGAASREAKTAVEQLAAHTGTVGRAFSAMGLEAGNAAARVEGLLGVIEEISGAIPELLAIGAAFVAVSASFAFVKNSIDEAARWQQELAVLGQTVRNQGGDWKSLSASVLQWADAQERATDFSRGEAIQALTQLTATGMKLKDAMIVTQVAEDAAAASGQSLSAVEHGLMEAMHGRAQALTMLGIGTKQSIHDGMSFKAVLEAIEAHMGGAAAAAADNYAGKMQQLKNTFETLQQDIGTDLLPALAGIETELIHLVQSIDEDLPTIEQDFERFYSAVKSVFDFIVQHKDQIEAIFDVIIGVQAVGAVRALQTSFIAAMASGGAFTTVVELMESVFTVGLVPSIQAVVAALGAAVTEETVATFGLNVLIAAIVSGAIYAFTHWSQVVDDARIAIQGVRWAVGLLETAIGELLDHFAGWIPGVHSLALGFEELGNKAQEAAIKSVEAIQAAQNQQAFTAGQSDISKKMAADEIIISHSSQYSKLAVEQAKRDLQELENQLNPTKRAPVDLSKLSSGLATTEVGGSTGGSSSSAASSVSAQAEDTNTLTAGLTSVAHASDAVKVAQKAMAAAIDPTTDSIKADADQQQHLLDAYNAAKASIPGLIAQITSEKEAEAHARVEVEKKYEAYQHATNALKNLENTLSGKTKLSVDEKKALNEAKEAQREADQQYKSADTTLKHVSAELNHHVAALNADSKATDAYVYAQDAAWKSYNDAVEKAQRTQQETEATYGQSLQQQISYWSLRVANEQAALDQIRELHKTADAAVLKQDGEDYAKLIDLETKSWENIRSVESKYVSTFLDDIIQKHQSFKTIFKSIWDDIVNIFIQDLTKMIVESKLFNSIFSNLLGFGGGGGGGLLAGALNPSSNPLAAGFGALGSGGALSDLIGTPGALASKALNVNIAGGSPGIFGSGGAGGFLTGGGFGSILGGLGIALGAGSLMGGLMHDAPGNHNADIGALLGVGALGMAAGWGGGLGAGLGALIGAGPAGWAMLLGAGLLGGAVGGLFGDHTNPHDSPDIYNTQTFGQAWADLGGAGVDNATLTANGQQFNESSSLAQQLGGKGEMSFISDFIKNNPQEAAKLLTPQEIQYFTGTQDQGGVTDLHNGNFTLSNGQTVYWSDLANAAQDATQKIEALGGAANSATGPLVTITRTYPDFNIAQTGSGGGSTSGGGHSVDPGGPTPVGSGKNPVAPVHQPPTGVGGGGLHIELSGNNTFVGPNGLNEVITSIMQAAQRAASGQVPGAFNSTPRAARTRNWG